MRKRKILTPFLCCALAVSLLLGTGSVSVEALSSDEIRNQINELERQEEELEKRRLELQGQYQINEEEILGMVAKKNLIDQEIALIYEQIDLINDQIMSYSLLIADKQDELDLAEDRLEALNRKNKERILAMEEEGEISYWSIIFEANSFSDLLDRLNMIQEIAAADRRRMQELSDAAEAVQDAQASLEDEKQALESTRGELDEMQEQLAQKRDEADILLLDLIAKGEEYEKLLDESEALQEELMAEIALLEAEYQDARYQEWLATSVPPTEASDTGSTTGGSQEQKPASSGWICPVPYYTLTSPFGMRLHPILGYERMHNGVDMACAAGTEIYAARSGKVTTAAYQANGAGNYVSINHGDGYSSIYMHMTRYIVSPGQYVTAGQVIGYVGNTGLSKGNHLHFGISYNGTYVNPMNYIG